MIVFASIVPHPPLSIEGIGTKNEISSLRKTLKAFNDLRVGLEKAKPDTVIIISPHGEMEDYNFVINSDSTLKGDYSRFGLNRSFEFKNDNDIVSQIVYCCEMIDMFVHTHDSSLDHGTLIPLNHLLKNINPNVVHMSFSLLSYEKHYEYGELISNVLENSKKRIAVIASGELSHRLKPKSKAGYSPKGMLFDQLMLKYLAENNIKALLSMENKMIKDVAECGLRSFLVVLGMIHQKKYKFNMLSYESPFGIGYLIARFL